MFNPKVFLGAMLSLALPPLRNEPKMEFRGRFPGLDSVPIDELPPLEPQKIKAHAFSQKLSRMARKKLAKKPKTLVLGRKS